MMVSTTLRRSAIHAADHLTDLELGPCAAAAAHSWDHPEDRAAARQVDRAQVAPIDRGEGPAPQNSGCGYTTQSFHTAWTRRRHPPTVKLQNSFGH
jgi:hypothetical protein